MKTIAIQNLKGGVAKTTVTKGLADYFASTGLRVLLVDLDYQSNLTDLYNLEWGEQFEIPIYQMFKTRKAAPIAVPGKSNIDILPNEWSAFPLNLELAGEYNSEQILKNILAQVATNYDICLIDCRPSFEKIELNAIEASDFIVVPTNSGKNSFKGISSYFSALELLQLRGANPNVLGVVLTMFDEKRKESKELISQLNQTYPNTRIFKNSLRPYEVVKHIEREGRTLLDAPQLRDSIIGLGDEILEIIK